MKKRLLFSPVHLPRRTWRNIRFVVAGVMLLGLISVGVWLALIRPAQRAITAARSLEANLTGLQASAASMEIAAVESAITSSRSDLETLQASLRTLKWVSIIPWIGGNVSVAEQLTTTGLDVLDAFGPFWNAVAPVAQSLTGMSSGESGGLEDKASGETIGETLLTELDQMDVEMTKFRDSLTTARFHLVSTSLVGVHPRLRSIVDELIVKFDQADQAMSQASELFGIMPFLLGKDAAQTYLIIIQNNTELRATGGFIGNFGLLTVNQGRIESLEINDVYTIDTDPQAARYRYKIPYPMGTYLQQQYLHFRDGNWWADFPTSSELLLDYFKFLTGNQVDGVIAIDPVVIEDVIRVLGPITIPEHNITVDADTVTYQIQYEVQKGFDNFANRKDFVSDLGSILFSRVMSEQGDVLKDIMKGVFTDFDQKHLQIYSTNTDIQSMLCKQNWCGDTAVTDGDFLQVVDSNIGINKVNFFATRSVSYTVDRTEDNELIAKVEINYNNPSNWGWPGGAYISYLRVYVPSGSELISEQGFLQKPGTATEYAGQAKEKTVFAGVVKVDIKSRQTVRLSYRLPVSLEGQEYRLTVQKQAGTPTLPGRPDYRGEAFTFSFSDEQNIYDGGAGDGTCAIDGSLLTCATDLSVDRIFTVAPRGI